MINECLDPDCRAHGELHRLREAREALTRRIKRLEDRVAELYEENERLRQEIQAETEREERLFVRLPFYEAVKAERDAALTALEAAQAEYDTHRDVFHNGHTCPFDTTRECFQDVVEALVQTRADVNDWKSWEASARDERDALRATVERVRATCEKSRVYRRVPIRDIEAALEGGDGNGDRAGGAD